MKLDELRKRLQAPVETIVTPKHDEPERLRLRELIAAEERARQQESMQAMFGESLFAGVCVTCKSKGTKPVIETDKDIFTGMAHAQCRTCGDTAETSCTALAEAGLRP